MVIKTSAIASIYSPRISTVEEYLIKNLINNENTKLHRVNIKFKWIAN